MKTHTKIALALVASVMASTAWAQNGTWTAYPGNPITDGAAIQQPINTDGSSKFKANGNAVIPVKFALSQETGPFVFESIGSPSPTQYADSWVSFAPNTTLTFNQITSLSAVYSFAFGDCHGGSLRWQVDTSLGNVHIYYGDYPNFTDCTTLSQSGTNLINMSDMRYDTSQIAGGTFYDTYAHTVTLLGSTHITGVSLIIDSGWGGDQVVDLTSATVATAAFSDTFTPQAPTPPTLICPTNVATIGITKRSTSPSGDQQEPMTIQPADNNMIFRIVDCKYMYNLATSSLGGTGTYDVTATINNQTFDVATFSLK